MTTAPTNNTMRVLRNRLIVKTVDDDDVAVFERVWWQVQEQAEFHKQTQMTERIDTLIGNKVNFEVWNRVWRLAWCPIWYSLQ